MSEREKNNFIKRARIAEANNSFESMAVFMKSAIKCGLGLNNQEIFLFELAYGKIANAKRASIDIINLTETRGASETDPQLIDTPNEIIIAELEHICFEALYLLNNWLIPMCVTRESRIICNKIKGNYYAYLVGVTPESEKQHFATEAQRAYNEAYIMAKVSLSPGHLLRLVIARNLGALYSDVLNDTEKAVQIVKEALHAGYNDPKREESSNCVLQHLHHLRMTWQAWLSSRHDTDNSEKKPIRILLNDTDYEADINRECTSNELDCITLHSADVKTAMSYNVNKHDHDKVVLTDSPTEKDVTEGEDCNNDDRKGKGTSTVDIPLPRETVNFDETYSNDQCDEVVDLTTHKDVIDVIDLTTDSDQVYF